MITSWNSGAARSSFENVVRKAKHEYLKNASRGKATSRVADEGQWVGATNFTKVENGRNDPRHVEWVRKTSQVEAGKAVRFRVIRVP